MLDKILTIKNAIIQEKELKEEKLRLSKPTLNDLNLLSMIYGWFCNIIENRDISPRIDSVHTRNKFIFISLYLYAPASLAGGRMMNNMRESLASILNCDPTAISHSIDNVMFQCQYYKYFRDEVEDIYNQICDKLKDIGCI